MAPKCCVLSCVQSRLRAVKVLWLLKVKMVVPLADHVRRRTEDAQCDHAKTYVFPMAATKVFYRTNRSD